MDSVFKISKKDLCGITVTGLERDNDEYLDHEIVSTRMYTYEQSTTINILEHCNSKEETSLESFKVVRHNVDCIDECDMYMKTDGLYSVYHIILPNEKWLQYVIDTSEIALKSYSLIYYYDESLDSFMKYNNKLKTEVTIEEILEVNSMADSEKPTTIIKGNKSTFLLCHLMECFYKISSELLQSLPERCPKEDSKTNTLTYYRDIFWMAINVIKYLLEKGQYLEASRILENITSCNLICDLFTDVSKKSCNCG